MHARMPNSPASLCALKFFGWHKQVSLSSYTYMYPYTSLLVRIIRDLFISCCIMIHFIRLINLLLLYQLSIQIVGILSVNQIWLTTWLFSSEDELIVYQWSAVCRRRRTWISLRQVGQSWSNFMCNITGVGERLYMGFVQIGSKLWFPWQQKAPINLQWVMRTGIKSWTNFNFSQIGPLPTELGALEPSKNFT